MKAALILFCLLFVSCASPRNKEANILVVSNLYKPKRLENGQIDTTAIPPLPLPVSYLKHHFIIDSFEQIYYYQLDCMKWPCLTGYQDTVPSFIGLKPKDFVQIPGTCVEDFARQNILNDEGMARNVVISTLKDTITAHTYFKLYTLLKDSVRWLNIRLATQEEVVVLKYKQNHKDYLPNLVHWDSSQIKFDSFP